MQARSSDVRLAPSGPAPGVVVAALMAVALSAPSPAACQNGVTLEVGASSVAPPSGLTGDPGRFLVGGLRASTAAPHGSSAYGFVLVGRSLDDATGGDFVSGGIGGAAELALSSRWAVELDGRAFGFDVDAPFAYRAYGIEGGPALTFRAARLATRVAAEVGLARSRVESHRGAERGPRILEDDLWRYGASAEVLVGSRAAMVGASAGVHESAGGRFSSVGVRLLVAGSLGGAELRVDSWDTPDGRETTGGLAFSVSAASVWNLRGYFGRSEPDPLTLAEPGGGSGGVLLGRRVLSFGSARPAPLHEVVGSAGGAARVRIAVSASADAQAVAVLGDFTLWEPVAMERVGDGWQVVLDVRPGTHHFGFLVDGAWYVPGNAPDVVPDEWGRENATMVIETGTPGEGAPGERY